MHVLTSLAVNYSHHLHVVTYFFGCVSYCFMCLYDHILCVLYTVIGLDNKEAAEKRSGHLDTYLMIHIP